MLRKSLIVLAMAASLAGCGNVVTNDAEDRAKLAAFAGAINYPAVAPAGTLSVGAIISADRHTVLIVNFSNRPITNANVWINRAFVQHMDNLPPGGTVDLAANRFYNKSGAFIGEDSSVRIDSVQIQDGDQLYNLLGPVNQ